jgi:hypothetical protein
MNHLSLNRANLQELHQNQSLQEKKSKIFHLQFSISKKKTASDPYVGSAKETLIIQAKKSMLKLTVSAASSLIHKICMKAKHL